MATLEQEKNLGPQLATALDPRAARERATETVAVA